MLSRLIAPSTRRLAVTPSGVTFALACVVTATLVARSAPPPGQAQPAQQAGPQQQAQPQQAAAPRGDAPRALTAADYARAERFLGPAVTPLVIGGTVAAELAARRALLVSQPGRRTATSSSW